MTKKQAFLRKQLIIKIHTHPRYKELKENEAWEDWLYVRYNEKSSGVLSINELNEILKIFDGMERDRDFALIDPDRAMIVKKGRLTFYQNQKIKSLSIELGWNESELAGFIKRQIKSNKAISELTPKEASKVILGLNKVSEYKKRERHFGIFGIANNPNYGGENDKA